MENKADFEFKKGDLLKDKITEFQGIVTGRADYLTGCNTYLLVPKVGEKGEFREGYWFDEQRLEKIKKTAKKIENKKNGADIMPPRTY